MAPILQQLHATFPFLSKAGEEWFQPRQRRKILSPLTRLVGPAFLFQAFSRGYGLTPLTRLLQERVR